MSAEVEKIIGWIQQSLPPQHGEVSWRDAVRKSLENFSADEEFELLTALSEVAVPEPSSEAEQVLDAVLQNCRGRFLRRSQPIHDETRQEIAALYKHLGPESRPRHQLLAILAACGSPDDLAATARILSTDPPLESLDATVAIAPLFQQTDYDPTPLYPELLKAIAHPQVAAVVLDLTNYLTRSKRLAAHPGEQIWANLVSLLAGVTERLQQADLPLTSSSTELAQEQRRIQDSVAIACGLCDALGQIGDLQAIDVLRQASQLEHRRIRVEAAAALARLGDDDGAKDLVQMAAHPITRLRVLQYAEELGLSDYVKQQFAAPQAIAESEVACHLAAPTQLGTAPTTIELLDHREQYWPSYEELQACYLFRFAYHLAGGTYENIAMAGPLVHSFQVELTQLTNEDIYALFAGWQAEHPDIREIAANELKEAHHVLLKKITDRLQTLNFTDICPLSLGIFFGEPALIGTATLDEKIGALCAGMDDAIWFAHDGISQRPLGPQEAWSTWKGRRLLKTFNS